MRNKDRIFELVDGQSHVALEKPYTLKSWHTRRSRQKLYQYRYDQSQDGICVIVVRNRNAEPHAFFGHVRRKRSPLHRPSRVNHNESCALCTWCSKTESFVSGCRPYGTCKYKNATRIVTVLPATVLIAVINYGRRRVLTGECTVWSETHRENSIWPAGTPQYRAISLQTIAFRDIQIDRFCKYHVVRRDGGTLETRDLSKGLADRVNIDNKNVNASEVFRRRSRWAVSYLNTFRIFKWSLKINIVKFNYRHFFSMIL